MKQQPSVLATSMSATESGPQSLANGDPTSPEPLRILVVDDNVDAANSLAMLLTLVDGHMVHVAHDGPLGLEMARRERPDVLLLDIGLPGMSGYELARRIRDLPGFESALIVALTGWGQDRDRQKSSDAGFDHHLVKPVEPEALREIFRTVKPAPTRSSRDV